MHDRTTCCWQSRSGDGSASRPESKHAVGPRTKPLERSCELCCLSVAKVAWSSLCLTENCIVKESQVYLTGLVRDSELSSAWLAPGQPERESSNDGTSVHNRYVLLPLYRQRLLSGHNQRPWRCMQSAQLQLACCMRSCCTRQFSAARDAKAEHRHAHFSIHVRLPLACCARLSKSDCALHAPRCSVYRATCCKPCAAPGLHTSALETLEQADASKHVEVVDQHD